MSLSVRLLLAALLSAAALPALAETPVLNLTAEGLVTAVPDTAIVTLGVVERADTAGAALTANNAAMARLLEELKTAGVADRDVQTSNFSIEPVMVYAQPQPNGETEPPKLVGYQVSNQVTVRIRGIAKTGAILDSVVRLGANQVQGISFTVDDRASLLDKARGEAMKTARSRAQLYADAGGFTLGRLLSVSEAGGRTFHDAVAAAPMMRMAEEAVPIAVGEQELSISVTVSWEILQPQSPQP